MAQTTSNDENHHSRLFFPLYDVITKQFVTLSCYAYMLTSFNKRWTQKTEVFAPLFWFGGAASTARGPHGATPIYSAIEYSYVVVYVCIVTFGRSWQEPRTQCLIRLSICVDGVVNSGVQHVTGVAVIANTTSGEARNTRQRITAHHYTIPAAHMYVFTRLCLSLVMK